jgi:hypothetical protein
MLKRIILTALPLTFLIVITPFNAYSQRRTRSSGKPNKQAPASPLNSEAALKNQDFWETLYVKCGDSYFGDIAPGLSQMRIVTFSITSRQLTEVYKEIGYEWRGVGVMQFSRRRVLTNGRWSDWVAANEDWMAAGGKLTATMQKKRGEWSASFSPFDKYIIANRPTCEQLTQYGIDAAPMRGVDIDAYCKTKYGNNALANNQEGHAYSWRCMVKDRNGGNKYFEINMDEACRMQYGSGFKSATNDTNDKYSWRCIPDSAEARALFLRHLKDNPIIPDIGLAGIKVYLIDIP